MRWILVQSLCGAGRREVQVTKTTKSVKASVVWLFLVEKLIRDVVANGCVGAPIE